MKKKTTNSGKIPRKILLFVLGLFFTTFHTFAQISGVISDEDGQIMSGVNIINKNTKQGTVSDSKGKYSINAKSGETITFSFIGYESREVLVGNQTNYNLVLRASANLLNDVVVVGYGTQKASSVTAAISRVSTKDLKALPVVSFTQAIQGRVPGVSVVNNSGPGTEPIVRIRGIGSISLNPNPLYVVDGIPLGGINNFDPKDIESMEILKDASSAAIYGSRAANGVVLITTKKGKSGKPKVNFDTYYGTQSVWRTLDLMNRDEYIKYVTTMITNAGGQLPGRFSNLNTPVYAGATQTFAQTDNDWQSAVFRSAPIQDHQISMTGGNDNSTYYASFGYFDQEGVIPNTDYKRYSFRINSDHKISKRIKFGQTLLLATDKRRDERDGTGRSVVTNIMRMTPYWPLTDPNFVGGYSNPTSADGTDPDNPLRIVDIEQKDRINTGFKLVGSAFAEVELLKDLKYKFTAATDFATSTFNGFLPIFATGQNANALAQLQENRNQFLTILFTNTLSYDYKIGKNNFSLLGIAERQAFSNRGISVQGTRSDNTLQVLQGVASPAASSSLSENLLISYAGRLNYDFDGKYLVNASIRTDGSSKFSPGNKWGVFPAASLGWRVSEENFMKEITAINELKLRVSYGETGFNNLGDYDWQAVVQNNNALYPFNNSPGTNAGSFVNTLGNPDLSWEKNKTIDAGLDLSLLNNKFAITLDAYSRQTDGLLLRVPVSPGLGYSNGPLANVGSMRNTGFELGLTYNIQKGDFKSSLTGSFDMTRNTVLSLATPTASIDAGANGDFTSGGIVTRTVAGQPIQSYFGFVTNGIFQNQGEIDALNGAAGGTYQNTTTRPGDIRFKDLDGDNKITANDRTFLGSFIPDFSYSLNYTGSFKGFDFTLFLQGVQGNKIYNGTKFIGQAMLRPFNALTDVLNAWTPTNTNTDVPRAINGDPSGNARVSDRWIEDGSYLRLKNLSIGYSIPSNVLAKYTNGTVSRFRIYVSSQNLFTLTKYTGYDPEIGNRTTGNLLTNGIDLGNYPQARTFMMGLNVSF
jgi:TonB-dependent starch-binding outer membrane protein SusC